MKLNALAKSLGALVVACTFSVPASAGFVIEDAWQLVLPGGTTTNIGHLNLLSGGATVQQEVNGSGDIFVGAQFSEFGQIFTINYTAENCVGSCDFTPSGGFPGFLGNVLQLSFSNVFGAITSISGTEYKYGFGGGDFSIDVAGGGQNLAKGKIVGIGGTIGATGVIGGANGDSALLNLVTSTTSPFEIRDSSGNDLIAQLLSGEYLLQATTNNKISGTPGSVPPTVDCSFDATKDCKEFTVVSDGQLDVVRVVPEPGSLALAGVALLGLVGLAGKRKA